MICFSSRMVPWKIKFHHFHDSSIVRRIWSRKSANSFLHRLQNAFRIHSFIFAFFLRNHFADAFSGRVFVGVLIVAAIWQSSDVSWVGVQHGMTNPLWNKQKLLKSGRGSWVVKAADSSFTYSMAHAKIPSLNPTWGRLCGKILTKKEYARYRHGTVISV